MKKEISFAETIKSLKNLSKVEKEKSYFDQRLKFVFLLFFFVLLLLLILFLQHKFIQNPCIVLRTNITKEEKKIKVLIKFVLNKAKALDENFILLWVNLDNFVRLL